MRKIKRFSFFTLFLAALLVGDGSMTVNAVHEEGTTQGKQQLAHHTTNGFRNIYDYPEHGFASFLRWKLGRAPDEGPAIIPVQKIPYAPDIVAPDYQRIDHPNPAKIQITWIGHATFLIQVEGINILTDPVFNNKASPLGIGFERKSPPGIPFDRLPPIHAVLLSHNHYDHLDLYTVKKLGNSPKYFIPLKLGQWFRDQKITNYTEMDWWNTSIFKGIRVVSVPGQHFSRRAVRDGNKTLWAGWVLETKHGKILFAGDTGYSPHFKEIREKLGPMRLALLPIGSYRPRWFMKTIHMDPPDAVSAHKDLQAEQSIAMHWGTFYIADEPLGEPPLYLKRALKEASISDDSFLIMKFGETRIFE
ncbi:MAG: MBL fold metallo-hydrolase [Smithellaceae bacterium]|nr:MBL fold metallo-hydrolase [Smithellaceae bacterium]